MTRAKRRRPKAKTVPVTVSMLPEQLAAAHALAKLLDTPTLSELFRDALESYARDMGEREIAKHFAITIVHPNHPAPEGTTP